MTTAFSLALLIFGGILAYHCAVYARTLLADARQQRVKRHLDWTVDRRRGQVKGGWRFW
jgi:hypothetical protein